MAEARAKGLFTISGLGNQDVEFPFNSVSTTAPTKAHYNYRQQAVADTAEALDLGGVTTVHKMVLRAALKDLLVDLDFSSAFDADMTIPAGEEVVITKPAGTVYIKNSTSNEQATYEYWIAGV